MVLLALTLACRTDGACTETYCQDGVAHTCDGLGNAHTTACEDPNPACVVGADGSATCVRAEDAVCVDGDAALCEEDVRFSCDTGAGYYVGFDCATDLKVCTNETEDGTFRCQ
jgi:hypothetical protein